MTKLLFTSFVTCFHPLSFQLLSFRNPESFIWRTALELLSFGGQRSPRYKLLLVEQPFFYIIDLSFSHHYDNLWESLLTKKNKTLLLLSFLLADMYSKITLILEGYWTFKSLKILFKMLASREETSLELTLSNNWSIWLQQRVAYDCKRKATW